MAKHYFKHLPDFKYKNPLASSNQSNNYVIAKNLFLRAKVKDDIINDTTFLKSYIIKEGKRPMDVAEEWYGSPKYDWVVLITANIINVKTDWPMTTKVLYDYCESKYGYNLNDTAKYETTEVKDSQGRLILPAGKTVDRDFSIPHPDIHNISLNPVIGISNYLLETRTNERKRNIKIMRPEYMGLFLQDMKEALEYSKSSQYENKALKTT